MFENQENNRLAEAAKEMRISAIDPAALARAEAGIMARVPVRRGISRPVIYWAAGFGTAALALSILLMPSRSFAAELRRIAQNGDSAVRHILNYTIQPDGSLKLSAEVYTDGERTRVIDPHVGQFTHAGGKFMALHLDGSVTIETQKGAQPWLTKVSDIVAADTNSDRMSDVSTSIKRGVQWNGVTADEYVIDGTFRDGQNIMRHSHMLIVADTASERPIEIDYELAGLSSGISKWDYPTPDPKLFELPTTPKTRVYDYDAERREVMEALSQDGHRVTAFGKKIELLQTWVDEDGNSCAITRADYAYPCNYGMHVDDLHLSTIPETAEMAARSAMAEPTKYKGRSVQLFFTNSDHASGPVAFNDRVTLRLPVFDGSTLKGYAKFENVQVHRSWELYFMLRPRNIPFWDDSKFAVPPPAPATR